MKKIYLNLFYVLFLLVFIVFSCKQTNTLPGIKKPNPQNSEEQVNTKIIHITKIRVQNEVKQNAEIVKNMVFSDVSSASVDVVLECSESGADIAFGNEEQGKSLSYKWYLNSGKNILNITVSKGTDKNIYTVQLNCNAKGVYVSYYLNSQYMTSLPNNFSIKAEKGEMPLFETQESYLNLRLVVLREIKGISINGKTEDGANKTDFYFSIRLTSEEMPINIVLYPLDEQSDSIARTCIAFKAKGGNQKSVIKPKLEISGDSFLNKEDFLDKLEGEDAPLYRVFKSPAKLSIKISDYEKNFLCKEIKIDDETAQINGYLVEKEIALEDGKERAVKVEFLPKNEDATAKLVWHFKLATGGEKPRLKDVQMFSINDAGTSSRDPLNPEFQNCLHDGSMPLYVFDGESAKVVVGSKKDVIKNITFKLDGAVTKTMPALKKEGRYVATEIFELEDDKEHNIEIIFEPKMTSEYSNMVYKFKLKKSGMLPTLPKSLFYFFTINGESNNKLPKDFVQHVTDGSEPTHVVKGREVIIEMKGLDKKILDFAEKVIFKSTDIAPSEVAFSPVKLALGTIFVAKYRFVLPDSNAFHAVRFEIIPKDPSKYRELIYSFKLKSDGSLMPIQALVGFNGQAQKDGAVATINGEVVNIRVQANYDILREVKIGEEGKDEINCEIKEGSNKSGKFYHTNRVVSLINEDSTPQKRIVVRLFPKDENVYSPTVYTYILTGTKIAKNNAQFVFSKDKPAIGVKVKFKEGCVSSHADDYGTLSASFTAQTLSPRAHVYSIISDPDGKPLKNASATLLKNNGDGTHISEDITFFEDKPTFVVLFVVAEDENTTDKEKGTWIGKFNPSYVRFDYEEKEKFADYTGEAYDEIVIDKTKVKDNKLYVAFIIWKESYGFSVDSSVLESYQSAFKKLNATKVMQSYMTEVNISTLIQGTVSELEIKLPIKRGTVDCMTYKVKIK